jgi:serine/threonine protein kinase
MVESPQRCPTPQDLAHYGQGKLTGEAFERVDEHIRGCPRCVSQLEQVPQDSWMRRLHTPKSDTTPPSRAVDPGEPWPVTTPDVPEGMTQLSHYRLLGRLGQGGMGTVYRAKDTSMDRVVALKLISTEGLGNPEVAQRFKNEVRAAAKLEHANIVRAYHAELDSEPLFLVMELVEGVDLYSYVNNKGPLSVKQAAHFVHQAARGLQHAHEKGLVHRDIKPQNLMVTRKGQVKVLDFGLAKQVSATRSKPGATAMGLMMGTPEYMAPEQSTNARDVDIRADVYSLGCTLWFLLTGESPFRGEVMLDVILAHHQGERPWLRDHRPDVPEELAQIVSKMMAKAPSERYQTPAEVAKALQPFATTGGAAEQPPSLPPMPAAGLAATPMPSPSRVEGVALAPPGDEFAIADLSPVTTGQGGRRPRGRRLPAGVVVLAGVLASLVTTALLALIVLKMQTPEGEVTLEIDQADAAVSIDGREIKIRVPGDMKPIEIKVMEGERTLEVKKDGFRTETRKFDYRKGDKKVVTVRMTPVGGNGGSSKPGTPSPAAVQDGYVPLFNGKDLAGWEVRNEEKAPWEVREGVLTGRGGRGRLVSTRGDYGSFRLRVEARVNNQGLSGILFRTQYGVPNPDGKKTLARSLKATLTLRPGTQLTGSITEITGDKLPGQKATQHALAKADLIRPDNWFTLEVHAVGEDVVTLINDIIVATCKLPPTSPRRGHFVLLTTGGGSVVEFRKIEVKELPPPPPPSAPKGPGALLGRELLRNPGCEEFLILGKIPWWKEVSGSWTAHRDQRDAHEGTQIFYATNSPRGELSQDIDVTGEAALIDQSRLLRVFSGWVYSAKQNPTDIDTTQIVVECRDAANSKVLHTYDTGAMKSIGAWKKVSDTHAIPQGTRFLRVRLISVRHGRGTTSNDGNYDGLSLKLQPRD